MTTQLGIVVTGRADHSSYPSYQSLMLSLIRRGIPATILDTWMYPWDLETEAGMPIYDLAEADLKGLIGDCIDDHGADSVTLVGFCSGAETALRYCRYDRRISTVIAISPTTWFRFPRPWDQATAQRRARLQRPYEPLFTRQSEEGEQVTFRLSPELYDQGETIPLQEHLAARGWNMPKLYFVALGSDTVCHRKSVKRLSDASRAPEKGFIELVGIGHDYRFIGPHIASVEAAVERCLEGGSFKEVWSIPFQAAKRCVAEVIHADPHNRQARDRSIRLWELLAYDFPSVSMDDRRELMGAIQRWYQTGWAIEGVEDRAASGLTK